MARRISISWVALAVFVAVGLVSFVSTGAVSLNVDEADAALDETGAPSFTQDDANSGEQMDDEQADQDMDEDLEDNEGGSNDDVSFLEDGEQDMEDFDFTDMNDEQAAELANSLDGEEREAFLTMWEEHKAEGSGHDDAASAFAEL